MSDIIQRRDLSELGQLANQLAAAGVFAEYRDRRSENTRRRQDNDLALFAEYLAAKGVQVGALTGDPAAWKGITWGLVEGFKLTQLAAGYAVSSVNHHLGTVRLYAGLAAKAGALDKNEYAMIRLVKGFRQNEARRVDEGRAADDRPTRLGSKKAAAVRMTAEQARQLKSQPPTPQGRRDALLMCLLLDHGLRVSEAAGLQVSGFDLTGRELRFYRPKVNSYGLHRLTPDTLAAAKAYLTSDAPALGSVWRASASKKDGKALAHQLTVQGWQVRAIGQRVRELGAAVGLEGLSPHDCRHFCATYCAYRVNKGRLTFADFLAMFGWTSPAMAVRYIEAAAVIDVAAVFGD